MVYARIDTNYTLKEILRKRDFNKLYGDVKNIESGDNINLHNKFLSNRWYTFHNMVEAKITIALKRVAFYESVQNKISDKDNLEQWHGEMIKSLPKTKQWLEKKEIKYPEYFL